MKHEVERQAPIVEENPGLRTSCNEGQASSGQNPTFLGKLRKKATIPLAVAGVATGLLGAKMFAPTERSTDQEALNSFKQRTTIEKVLSETGDAITVQNAKAEGVIGEPAFKAASFPDVSESNPYYEAITGMADAGIISGFDDGTFGPDKLVTRQQFAKMIVGAMSPTVAATEDSWQDSNKPFNDLVPDDPNSLYPNDYVAVAAANGITQGKSPGKYAPYDNITRAQVDTMMVRAAKNLQAGRLATPPEGYQSILGNFSPDHTALWNMADYNGLLMKLADYDNSWDPWQNATRGEVAQMLWNLKNYKEQTKSGADLVGLEKLAQGSLSADIQALINKDIPNPEEISKITLNDPANATKEISFYIVKTADKSATGTYFVQESADGELFAGKIQAQPIIMANEYKTYVAARYFINPSVVPPTLFAFELGGVFQKLENETQDMYAERASQQAGSLQQEHGDGSFIKLGEITDLLSQSEGFMSILLPTVIKYSSEQTGAIKKIANIF